MNVQIHPWGESCSPTPPLDLDAHRAYLEAIIANPRTNDGRRAWARAELKKLKEARPQ